MNLIKLIGSPFKGENNNIKNPLEAWQKSVLRQRRLDDHFVIRLIIVLISVFFLILLVLNGNGYIPDGKLIPTSLTYTLGITLTAGAAFVILRRFKTISNKRLFLVCASCIIQLFAINLLTGLCLHRLTACQNFLLLFLPYTLAPIITTELLGRRMGLFSTLTVSLFTYVLVPAAQAQQAVLLSMLAGGITILSVTNAKSRRQITLSGFHSGFLIFIFAILLGLVPIPFNTVEAWITFTKQAIVVLGSNLLISILFTGGLPLLEDIFHLTTTLGWLERSDLNNPLLRRLQYEAPGTFHHSLVVAQLAEAAAEAIGANAYQCRVCAYYHDIGKLAKPDYFSENIQDQSRSPHLNLAPLTSAKILMKHVEDGVQLATENHLEPHIIEAITEHHGNSLVSFLYQKALDDRDAALAKVAEGKANEEDVVYPEESQFRYSGKIPQSREVGIISLADAAESATRTLMAPTEENIRELVDRIIRYRINEHQLDDSLLTLADLKIIGNVFVDTLKNMYHSRISYPASATISRVEKEVNPTETQPILPSIPTKTENILSPTPNIQTVEQEPSKEKQDPTPQQDEDQSSL